MRNTETNMVYNDDRPSVLRTKCAEASALRAATMVSYLIGLPQFYQSFKLVRETIDIATAERPPEGGRLRAVRERFSDRSEKAGERLFEVPRDLRYQGELFGRTFAGAFKGGERAFESRAAIADLEWRHTRGNKRRCLMQCFQPINNAIVRRIHAGETDELPALRRVLEAQRDWEIRNNSTPTCRQAALSNWVIQREKNTQSHLDQPQVGLFNEFYSESMRPAKAELYSRLGFASGDIEKADILLESYNYQDRFAGTSYRACGEIPLSKKDNCFASALIFAKQLRPYMHADAKDVYRDAKILHKRLKREWRPDVIAEQGLYRSIVGQGVSEEQLAPYIELLNGEERDIPLAREINLYLEDRTQSPSLRQFIFDHTPAQVDAEMYGILVELDLRIWQYDNQELQNPQFWHLLASKNQVARWHQLRLEPTMDLPLAGGMVLLCEDKHVKALINLDDENWILYDPAKGCKLLPAAPELNDQIKLAVQQTLAI
jgi:hypothetical protein